MLFRFAIIFFILLNFTVYSQSLLKISEIGDFELTNGEMIQDCKVAYRTYGRINEDSSNVILFPTWFGGTSEHLAGLIGADKFIDSAQYFIITVDALGNGVSSSPSNSILQPNDMFPEFNIEDMVNSQYLMLKKEFGFNNIYALFGGSMGGMQVFEWLVSYPGYFEKAVEYVGSPRLTSSDLLLWQAELNAIEVCLKYGCSREEIIKTVALIQSIGLQTSSYKSKHIKREEFNSFLQKTFAGFDNIFNEYDWASQLRAMMQHDITKNYDNSLEKTAAAIDADLLIIAATQDQIVNPLPAIEFAGYTGAELLILENDCGHLAPGCEIDIFKDTIHNFLRNNEVK